MYNVTLSTRHDDGNRTYKLVLSKHMSDIEPTHCVHVKKAR